MHLSATVTTKHSSNNIQMPILVQPTARTQKKAHTSDFDNQSNNAEPITKKKKKVESLALLHPRVMYYIYIYTSQECTQT